MVMIVNKQKLNGCDQIIIGIVKDLELNYFTVLNINSGFRTKEENKKAGGAKDSAHLTGKACDISAPNTSCIKVADKLLYSHGDKIKGMGLDLYKNYTHFDIKDRGEKEIVYWPYDRNGKVV